MISPFKLRDQVIKAGTLKQQGRMSEFRQEIESIAHIIDSDEFQRYTQEEAKLACMAPRLMKNAGIINQDEVQPLFSQTLQPVFFTYGRFLCSVMYLPLDYPELLDELAALENILSLMGHTVEGVEYASSRKAKAHQVLGNQY